MTAYFGLVAAFIIRFLDPPEDEVWTRKGWVAILVVFALLSWSFGFVVGVRKMLFAAGAVVVLAVVIADDSGGAALLYMGTVVIGGAAALLGARSQRALPTRFGAVAVALAAVVSVLVIATPDPVIAEIRVTNEGVPFEASYAFGVQPLDGLNVQQWSPSGRAAVFRLRGGGPAVSTDDQGVARIGVGAVFDTLAIHCAEDREIRVRLDEDGWWRDRWTELNGERARVTFEFGPCLSPGLGG